MEKTAPTGEITAEEIAALVERLRLARSEFVYGQLASFDPLRAERAVSAVDDAAAALEALAQENAGMLTGGAYEYLAKQRNDAEKLATQRLWAAESIAAERDALRERCAVVEKISNEIRDDLTAEVSWRVAIEADRDALGARVEMLEGAIRSKDESMAGMQRVLDEKRARVAALESEARKLIEERGSLEACVRRVDQLESEARQLSLDLQESQKRVAVLEARLVAWRQP